MSLKITGKLPSGPQKQQLQQSPHYKNGSFQNLSETPMKPESVSYWEMLWKFFKKYPATKPQGILPFVKTDLTKLNAEVPVIVWFGHSSYFIRIANKNFLIDPVFSGSAAPFPFMVKAFRGSNEYKAADMPAIDYLILTHDHYDHLDFKTIRQLKNKIGHVYCSLGLSAHLTHWGIPASMVTELDWWESAQLEAGIRLTATPARHFSGRGIKRGQTFWSSFVLNTSTHNLYLGGDSGYDTHFKEIGKLYGPFDIAILESGQYNTMWPLIHMMPEEMVQAAVDLKAGTILPVHWGKFKLSMHPWDEPVRRVLAKAEELNKATDKEHKIKVVTPRIGEMLLLNDEYQGFRWWEF